MNDRNEDTIEETFHFIFTSKASEFIFDYLSCEDICHLRFLSRRLFKSNKIINYLNRTYCLLLDNFTYSKMAFIVEELDCSGGKINKLAVGNLTGRRERLFELIIKNNLIDNHLILLESYKKSRLPSGLKNVKSLEIRSGRKIVLFNPFFKALKTKIERLTYRGLYIPYSHLLRAVIQKKVKVLILDVTFLINDLKMYKGRALPKTLEKIYVRRGIENIPVNIETKVIVF